MSKPRADLNAGEGPEPDDDQETCENCRKKFDIESMTLMEDCWFCKDCTADWQKHFDACDHEWEPRGDDEKLCRKCSGVVRVDVTEPSSPSASGRSQPAPDGQLRAEIERLKKELHGISDNYATNTAKLFAAYCKIAATEYTLTEAVERCAKVAESCLVKFSVCKSGILQDQIDIARKDIAAAIRATLSKIKAEAK